jgi:hypothetical protein
VYDPCPGRRPSPCARAWAGGAGGRNTQRLARDRSRGGATQRLHRDEWTVAEEGRWPTLTKARRAGARGPASGLAEYPTIRSGSFAPCATQRLHRDGETAAEEGQWVGRAHKRSAKRHGRVVRRRRRLHTHKWLGCSRANAGVLLRAVASICGNQFAASSGYQADQPNAWSARQQQRNVRPQATTKPAYASSSSSSSSKRSNRRASAALPLIAAAAISSPRA